MEWVWLVLGGLVAGALLGLLGGGGTLLVLPLLVALGFDTRQAIPLSLAVVCVTAALAAALHARGGRVAWRAGLLFGGFAMAGGYAGGRAAAFVPERALVLAFAALMLATAVAMTRGPGNGWRASEPHPVRVALLGAAIGAVTGVVGAGGGFLFVPVLHLLAGLPLANAVATSLLVIALNAGAGLAGQLRHAELPVVAAGALCAGASLGAVAGVALSGRVRQESLRRAFSLLLAGLACWLIAGQVPALAPFTVHPAWLRGAAGGVAIGAASALLLLLEGRIAGISGILGGALQTGEGRWRLAFLAGLPLGALLFAAAAGAPHPRIDAGPLLLVAGGLLVGYGTRLGSGCTSGHGVCGIARGARRSIAATLTFMLAGAATVFLRRHLL